MAAQQRQQPPVALARLVPARDEARQIGPVVEEPVQAAARTRASGRRAPGSSTSTANSGISPTIERTRSGTLSPSGRLQHVVEELVLARPRGRCRRRRYRSSPRRCTGSARRTWSRCPRRPGCASASSSAMRIRFERVHRHPGGAVGLVDVAAGRQRLRAVEDADVVEPEKAALEDVAAVGVLAVHPPGEIQHQLVEDAFEEGAVAARRRVCALVDLERRARRPRRAPAD